MIEFPDDTTNDYTTEEERVLTEHLTAVTTDIHSGRIRNRRLDLALVCDLHAAIFAEVRGHAGRHRRKGRGSEWVVFGPFRSAGRAEVDAALTELCGRIQREEAALDALATSFELDLLALAVKAHADFIRIHPFEDGNGRVGRLIAGHLLARNGLHPVPIEAVKQEYTEALNRYYTAGDLGPILDLYIALYPVER